MERIKDRNLYNNDFRGFYQFVRDVLGTSDVLEEQDVEETISLDEYKGHLRRIYTAEGEAGINHYKKYMGESKENQFLEEELLPNTIEYQNLGYTIYKALSKPIKYSILRDYMLRGMELTRTEQYYLIHFNTVDSEVKEDIKELESEVKEEVSYKLGGEYDIFFKYGEDSLSIVIREPSNKVTFGDILKAEYEGDTVLGELESTNKVLLGSDELSRPILEDLDKNPVMSIVGGSGTGKSYLLNNIILSMLMTNTPEELNLLILDVKDSLDMKTFKYAPHTLGYHSDTTKYEDILKEVMEEHTRRMGIIHDKGYTTLEEYNKENRSIPQLVVLVDEIAFTMVQLQREGDGSYEEVKELLTILSAIVRPSGIKVIISGQRAIDTVIPRDYLANTSTIISLKPTVSEDNNLLFGRGYESKVSKVPNRFGEAIIWRSGEVGLTYTNLPLQENKTMEYINLRNKVIALDWVKRTLENGLNYTEVTEGMDSTIVEGYNRDVNYREALEELDNV